MYRPRSNEAPSESWDNQQDQLPLTSDDCFSQFSVPPGANHIGTLQRLVEDINQTHSSQGLNGYSPNNDAGAAFLPAQATWQPARQTVRPCDLDLRAPFTYPQATTSPKSAHSRLNAQARTFVPQQSSNAQPWSAQTPVGTISPRRRSEQRQILPGIAHTPDIPSQYMHRSISDTGHSATSQLPYPNLPLSGNTQGYQFNPFSIRRSPPANALGLPSYTATDSQVRAYLPAYVPQLSFHPVHGLPTHSLNGGTSSGELAPAFPQQLLLPRWGEGPFNNLGQVNTDRLAPPKLPHEHGRPRLPASDDGSTTTLSCEHPGCTRTFSSRSEFKHHIRWHGERDKICATCSQAFVAQKDLKRHLAIHRPEDNAFFCDVESCLYHVRGFGRKDHLKRHQKTHLSSTASSRSRSRNSRA